MKSEAGSLPKELRGDLLLADRGYFEKEYLADVDRAGGSFVVRASASINPVVRRRIPARRGARGVERAPLEGMCAFATRWLIWMSFGGGAAGISSACGGEMEPAGRALYVVGDESCTRPVHGAGGGSALSFAVAGGADVQGMEVVCESSCVRYEQCGDCARAHLDGNFGVDSETLLGSNDAGSLKADVRDVDVEALYAARALRDRKRAVVDGTSRRKASLS